MPRGVVTKEKHCIICNKLFLPRNPSCKICDDDHYTQCPICGKEMIWNSTRKVEPCSKECKKENRRRLNLEKYGVEHPMQCEEVRKKHRESMKAKYGVESPLQCKEIKERAIETNLKKFGSEWALGNKDIQSKRNETMKEKYGGAYTLQCKELSQKVKQTMQSKYGVDNAMKSDKFKSKSIQTCLEKFGCTNAMQNEEILLSAIHTRIENNGAFWTPEIDQRAKKTFLERYGVDNPSKSQEIQEKIKQTCLDRYGVEYRSLIDSNNINSYKLPEINQEFASQLNKIGLETEHEFYLDGKFYDIHIPDSNILIEINPTYTHNAIGNHWNKDGIKSSYHLNKSEIAEKNGFRCIHVFQWDDISKIINILAPKKKIFARKCTIYRLNPPVSAKFLNKFHLQNSCRGQLLHLGLVYDNVLYQVMTFGKSRYSSKHDVELLRLCTRTGYTVTGGASKLFSYATSEYGLCNIISYCDKSKFTGEVYEKIGMKFVRSTPPQEVWSKEDRKITANLLRSRGFDQLFGTNHGKGTSNEELMIKNGWLPVYDCGQNVYEF